MFPKKNPIVEQVVDFDYERRHVLIWVYINYQC